MLYEIEFPLAELGAEAVESTLLELGAIAITLEDEADQPVFEPAPGEVRLWSRTRVRAMFDESRDVLEALAALGRALGAPLTAGARVRAVDEHGWERAWTRHFGPMRFGRRLWVCPTDAEAPASAGAVTVRLDPGLAFGTGSHPTTALCLQVLDSLELEGRTVIDYGSGSGILAIAALKLGAARAVAIDIDPQALTATRANAARNGLAGRIETHAPPVHLEPADVVLANILAGPLVELAPRLSAACRPGGALVLSGLLRSQAYEVKAAYAGAFDIVSLVHREDWCCIHGRRNRA